MTQRKALGPDIQKLYTYYELPIGANAIGLPPGRKTGLWRYTRPLFEERIPPCQEACPAGNWIQKFVRQAGSGDLDEAWKVLRLETPFPGVCGRVCYHPCEESCNRKDLDESTSIHSVERSLADHFFREQLTPPLVREKQGKRIAVVGSGPAGLSGAYFLIMMGYEVTVFEARNELGGIPQIAIPTYRLPRKVLDKEINDILSLGVEAKKGCRVGRDVGFSELLSYDAVFLATGAHKASSLNIEGEASDEGIFQGLDFLTRYNLGDPLDLGESVLVIGGGNVAIDVSRTLIRLGCSTRLLYRRTRNEMPAHPEEVEDASEEGLQFQYLLSPSLMQKSKGGGFLLECTKMKIEGVGTDGRPQAVPIEGESVYFEADRVILATGELPDLSYLPQDFILSKGLVRVNQAGQTNVEKVFAGGDIIDQPWTVAEAIGSAKRAAIAMDHYLTGHDLQALINQGALARTMRAHLGLDESSRSDAQKVATFRDLNIAYSPSIPKHTSAKLSATERVGSFREVDSGLSVKDAKEEASRCLSCGVCKMCGNCYLFCPDGAVQLDQSTGRYVINYEYCKGCGICFRECPVATITVTTEGGE